MGIIAIILTVSVCVSLSVGQVDLTVVAESRGETVVEAVVSRIRQSGIFSEDHLLLRRIAYVETNDGNDSKTYRSGYHGGIWQVNETGFQETKNPVLVAKHNRIRQIFDIDWSSVQWLDLRKPLYSGLGAWLLLSTIQSPIPLASDISAQAQFWKQHYNTATGTGTVQTFIENAVTLDQKRGCQSGIDLIFVLDASGSIGSSNFNLVRNFVSNVVRNSDIGSDKTRVGVVLFSSSASVQFNLNTHLTKPSLLQAVANIPYTTGGTNTAEGIDLSIQQFSTAFGARPRSSGIPRIAIVVTDGQSNNPSETIAAAERAHLANILSYAVGVGNSIDLTELNAIASAPQSQFVRLLTAFDTSELRSLQETLNNEACTAPAIFNVGQIITLTLQPDQVSFLQFTLPTAGVTLHLNVSIGSVVLFGSNEIRNPNVAFYDFKLSNNRPAEVFINEEMFGNSGPSVISTNRMTNFTNITVYVSIQGPGTFTLNTTIGDTTTGGLPQTPPVGAIVGGSVAAIVLVALLVVLCVVITIVVTVKTQVKCCN